MSRQVDWAWRLAQDEVTTGGGPTIDEHMGGGKGDRETIVVNYNKGMGSGGDV